MKKAVYSKTVFKIPYLNIFKKSTQPEKMKKFPISATKKKKYFKKTDFF